MENKMISEEIEIPSELEVEASGKKIKISKGNEKIEKALAYPFKLDGKKIIFSAVLNKKNKKLIKTSLAHIRNIISGLGKKYVYKMQVCSVHFPMTVTVKGQELVIKNFLGEVKERKAKILEEVNVKVDKEFITIESSDKEKAGQTAANIESATKIRNKDKRVFQDGIYITDKEKGKRK
ncbi:MAG: 50S ribosomal protein L6 [Candidatus Pacearchaeota archaeon]|nr:50S ribosomal protein L6 [Candidatus Pacearchaeota archaeon]